MVGQASRLSYFNTGGTPASPDPSQHLKLPFLYLRRAGVYNPRVNKNNPNKTAPSDSDAKKIVISNRKARHEFLILETVEAGLALVGTEVKSIRAGQANLQDAFAKIDNDGEVWLHNMHVQPYTQGNRYNPEPRRPRKLLLHRKQINALQAQMDQKGLTLVPLALFFQRGFAKMELGLAKGKKLYDKRDDIAKRDVERERQREMSNRE
jgi:SsrA-binding protein